MNCHEAENYIYAYCEANLSPELCLQLEEHLKTCENCRNLLELTRMENAVLKDALALDYLDDQFTRRVMNAVAARNMASTMDNKAVKSRGKRPYWHFATAAAIILLFTAFAPGIYNNLFTENSQISVAIKDSAMNQETVDKALEIAREEKLMAGAGEPESAAKAPSAMDAGNAAQDYASTYGSGTVETEYERDHLNNSPALIDPNAPVQISMIDAPPTEIMKDSNGILRSAPPIAYKSASPNRYRSYAVSVPVSLEDHATMPVALPDNFILEKSMNKDSAVIYIYSETNSNQAVELSIEPYATASIDLLTLAESDIKSDDKESAAAPPMTQHLEVIAEYDNNKYLVKLKSSLSIDELLKLAEEIRLAGSS